MTRLHALWDSMRASYWVVPAIMAALATVLSLATIQLDRASVVEPDSWSWVYTGGPEGARGVLSTVAASMIGVAGVAFSITMVVLTLASQQFGPRLLRHFLRDLGNQVVLGTFIATFLYCLLVLRTVRGNDDATFVPHLSVTVGVLLAMANLGVLIYFIHHVATSIQASQIIANVAADLDRAIERLFPERIGSPDTEADTDAAVPDDEPFLIRSHVSGYVQAIDGNALMDEARTHDLLVRVEARPGTFVPEGRVLLRAWAAPGTAVPADALRDTFVMGVERTGTQDLAFYVEQLVELAVRALSPGVNDPGTALACIDRLEQALSRLAARRLPPATRRDDTGRRRVIAESVTFAGVVELALSEVARYGRGSVPVTCRLLRTLAGVAPCVRHAADHAVLLRHATTLTGRALAAIPDAVDRHEVERCHGETIAELVTAARRLQEGQA